MPVATGSRLGPYEILSPLGAGGMGEVYRAHDSRLDRTVAIKILPTSFVTDHDRLQRFAQEARAAAALNHPNILSIFDIGEDQGTPYVVSELLEGETLRARLQKAPIPLRKAMNYALQVARGLAAAHEKGIVHRDLKPENLFITNDDRVKILDFGLAKMVRQPGASDLGDDMTAQFATEAGMVLGTVGYMSPEQVRGKPAVPESDIFAFGAILYEMVSGKRAFHRDSAADTMSAILHEEPPELAETARNVPSGLERIVRHCLEKNPAQRFHSAGDLAFDLEAMTDVTSSKSGVQAAAQQVRAQDFRRKLGIAALVVGLAAATAGLGWWIGRGSANTTPPEYQQITFRTGAIGNARFTPDGSVVYQAAWDGGQGQLYLVHTDEHGSRELGFKDAELLAISKTGELAIRLDTIGMSGYARVGTLARVPLSGGTPREVLENVQDADWSPSGDDLAVVRFVPENRHWRLEYPIGKVLIDGINWISNPRISSDGKWVAFGDHENSSGDDEGSVAVIGPDGKEKKLTSGWLSIEGIAWSPTGDEVWFTGTRSGSSENLRGVTLGGKLRDITNVPGGMWLQDVHNGLALTIAQHVRIGIRGISPGGTEERELGWFGWSIPRDISRDGTKLLFEEEGEGGGPNYTVFLRDTDGSPPVKIGEGRAEAISPDAKWVITQPIEQGPLRVVPTGAGEARQLTHDNIRYTRMRYLPDGKHLLAVGIETGHGARDYLIDVSNGNAKPVTPEGTAGVLLSPDGRGTLVIDSEGKWGVWSLDGNTVQPIPDLDSKKYYVTGWTPDGSSVYALSSLYKETTAKVNLVNVTTGKMEYWKTFGDHLASGVTTVAAPHFSADGRAYTYIYVQTLSEAFVVKGLK
ncbi:MAG: protein kinase [Candidatus Korobacteraceae bacterium]